MCLERWRHFLVGVHFTVLSDHAALTYLTKQAHLSRRQARWLDFFQEFSFDIVHIPGKKNVADYLSRIPGAEQLTANMLCSVSLTLGMNHLDDLDTSVGQNECTQANLANVVSIFEESSFLERLGSLQ